MTEETITISKERYANMVKRLDWLSCLEAAGVDNWEGISYAYELLEEDNPSEED